MSILTLNDELRKAAFREGYFDVDITSAQSIGLVGFWPLGWSKEEKDFSLFNNPGNRVGLSGPTRKVINHPRWGGIRVLDFPGSGAHVDAGDVPLFDGVSQMTWTFWINRTSDGDDRSFISKWGGGGANNAYLFEFDQTFSDGTLFIGGAQGTFPNGTFSDGIWYHVAIVFNGIKSGNSNRLRVYVDSLEVGLNYTGTIPASLNASSRSFQIGGNTHLSRYVQAMMSDVRIYNLAQSESMISQIEQQPWSLITPLGVHSLGFVSVGTILPQMMQQAS